MTPGAVRRRETTETVRDRMSNLFATSAADEGEMLLRAARSAGPPRPGPLPGADPEPSTGTSNEAEREPEPDLPAEPAFRHPCARSRWRSALMLHPAMMLDRRALLGLGVLLLFAVGYAVQHFWLARPQSVAIPVSTAVTAPAATRTGAGPPPGSPAGSAPSGPTVVVDVAGRVPHPGLRTLPSGSRVADALGAAGGPLPDTDTAGLNLARVLTDGEQIVVGAPAGQPASAVGGPRTPLSLNHATIEQLDALPGVGPTLAQRIVLFRQEHGGFRSLDQLRQVSGIGERKFGELRALLNL
ncbi:ComEA family DNA-binding protein [Kitasatospora atroaurantiaca]|uniref:Competence protein ComEA n=2 Tax=Kitasatospora atroaurantiaca TaxID=285545 RepID=A0A561EP12_9ACTN|nr:competence protein ComEA [Kitasatospora atroaurantiaca]